MTNSNFETDTVAVLMCTYNGADYLEQQLHSFSAQSHKNWLLYASDDGSNDTTREILAHYQQLWSTREVKILEGPAKGFVENFISVTRAAEGSAAYYAWSDQDDIWHADKLERALQWLKSIPEDKPALYCGRTQLVDEANQELGLSMLFRKQPSFANALMQNIGGGNTMVFNQAACRLILQSSENTQLVSHDWWAYIIISGAGGRVFYDQQPCLRYRQHDDNLIGANTGWVARIIRIRKLLQGRFREWNTINIAALQQHKECLTANNIQIMQRFTHAKQKSLLARLVLLKRSGVYRQTLMGNLGLVFAAVFNKL